MIYITARIRFLCQLSSLQGCVGVSWTLLSSLGLEGLEDDAEGAGTAETDLYLEPGEREGSSLSLSS